MDTLDRFVHQEFISRELKQSEVYRYLDRYMTQDIFDTTDIKKNENVKCEKTIWIPWLQGIEAAPPIVKECVKSVYRNKPDDFDLIIVTEKNIEDYIEVPDFIKDKYKRGIMSKTHMADFMRIELLCMYGGCWMDASVYCGDTIPSYMLSGDFFIFKSDYVSAEPIIKMSSWYIFTKRNSRILKATRNILHKYWAEEEEEIKDYYLLHLIMSKLVNEDFECRKLYQKVPYFSNSNAHVLYGMLNEPYSEARWDVIKAASVVQKLSFKQKFVRGDLYTFHSALFDEKLV